MPEIIKFDDPVVLIGGADVNLDVLQRYSHLPVVAVDGGANHLRDTAIKPEVIVGDLDSLNDQSHWQSVAKVVEVEEQDSTDFEKCLYTVDAPYYIAVGFTGNRLDHTLASLHVMKKYLHKRVVLVGSDDVVCLCNTSVELQLPPRTRVSVFPMDAVTFVSSVGLVYPLNDLTMEAGKLIGTSNTSSEPQIKMTPKMPAGCYAVILPVAQLDAMRDFIADQVPAI